jgi:hypothetical protein
MPHYNPRAAIHPVYPKVVPDEFNPGYHSVMTPTHHYRSVPQGDVPVLLQHLHDIENYDGLPTDFRVRYTTGTGSNAAGTEYEQWPGEPTEDAIRAHVGDEIDWPGGRAEVVGIYRDIDGDIDQEGNVAWVTFIVRPVGQR